ncbi:MAG TPA: right-handed parallel beta-helix repeat-containing protein [Flavisolibacter sp.]|nr:right-handed parallel beta-helix repeat-containing protein [Flavisolibacter sp.]
MKKLFTLLLLITCGLSYGRTVTVPSWIDGTGATDVTGPLRAFFDGVRDTTTVVLPPGKTYRVEGILLLTSRKSLHIDLNGSRIIATTDGSKVDPNAYPSEFRWLWPRKRSQFAVRGSLNTWIYNGEITGANPYNWTSDAAYNAAYEAQHNLDFEGCDGVQLYKLKLSRPWGDFIYFGKWGHGNLQPTRNVTVTECEMHDNGRQGVSFAGAENIVVTCNKIYNTRRSTFDIEPDAEGTGTKYLYIKNNFIGPGRLMFVASGGSTGGGISYVTIEGNVLLGRPMSIAMGGGAAGQRHHITIRNNTGDSTYLYGSPRALIEMVGVDYITVTGNKHWFAPMQRDDLPGEGNDAVQVDVGKAVYINGNTWTGAERASVLTGCTVATAAFTVKSDFGITGIKKVLPVVSVGYSSGTAFPVLSKYKKYYQLLSDGKQVDKGTLNAGYNTLPATGSVLQVATTTF